ncbi:MAG: UDP-N-acetylglucosamine 2-epimerase, partial [Phycisphaerae bacterium]|nr:UDP-N-acetylglucosamine 2-epimerase [Phycisphaerae bacterium]
MKRIAVVTGSRADFGLLRPVIAAIAAEPELELRLVVTGTHLLPPSFTHETVSAQFDVATRIPMQVAGEVGRDADAAALGRGVSQLAQEFAESHPDVVLVLGDRIEAFAAAAAAAVGGRHVGHIHGGDRAEGVADDAMRHAITKLAHLH